MSIPKAFSLSSYDYQLPADRIAQHPPEARRDSRLLHLEPTGAVADLGFGQLGSLLRPGDLLVVNDTRVIPARLVGAKPTGGQVEVFLERLDPDGTVLVQLKASRAPGPGQSVQVAGVDLEVMERAGRFFRLRRVDGDDVMALFVDHGEVPLPPYIDRGAAPADTERYQTVYAQREGAVAAPTAGLHFDEDHLATLAAAGVGHARITLHVGAGTFHPVQVDDVREHAMHAEWIDVSAATAEKIRETRAAGGRIVAVGTTVVRALETAAAETGDVQAMRGDTSLFIGPGHRFNAIDALITNFHLPRSTLLVLVCAFAGYDQVMGAYAHAVQNNYRFFSYGDAMFLQRPGET